MKIEFKRDIMILPDDTYKIDKSLLNSRNDFSYIVKDYDEMLKEMNHWMKKHNNIYNNYGTIL